MIRMTTLLIGMVCFLVGCGMPSFLVTPVSNLNELQERRVYDGSGRQKIVIIPIEGLLVNARSTGLISQGENPVSLLTQQLQRAEQDSSVVAVVLRVNSPGGSVTASDTMYQLIRDFRVRTGKPVIASVQDLSASGAFYVSMAADEVIAQPTSVIGSVGVILNLFNFQGTLSMIGAQTYTLKSGELKDIGSPLRTLTDNERAIFDGMLNQYFQRFLALVATKRNLSEEQLEVVADGRIFTGEQALELNLVDRLGSLEDAIELARIKSGAYRAPAVIYIRPHGYGGSIYASNQIPSPQASQTMRLKLPLADEILPVGFFYLWQPIP